MSLSNSFERARPYTLTAGVWLIILYVAQVTTAPFDLFTKFPPIDIPFHMMGGICISLLSIAIISFFNLAKNPKKAVSLILLGTLFFGLAWEAFELIADIVTQANVYNDALDTIGDIINDMIGGIAVVYYYKKYKK